MMTDTAAAPMQEDTQMLAALMSRLATMAAVNGGQNGDGMAINSTIMQSRQYIASALGKMFDGDRDVYFSAGYKRTLTFEDFYLKFRREHITRRIIVAAPTETWRVPPVITDTPDDDPRADEVTNTPFIDAWMALANNEMLPFGDGDDDLFTDDARSIWHYLERADKLAGIGEYAVIVLGIDDGSDDLSQPLAKNTTTDADPQRLLYLKPYHQGRVSMGPPETDPASPRYGRPVYYEIEMGESSAFAMNAEKEDEGEGEAVATNQTLSGERIGHKKRVHYTRVIHIAEDPIESDLYGTPRLEAVFNILDDILKITAASGESAWKLIYKGIIATTKDGYTSPNGADEATQQKLAEYVHGLVRYMGLDGYDVNIEGGEIVDPTSVITILLTLIAAATGIPQRLLLGSERGELASSQDEKNWKERIESRQSNHAGPVILRPLINRLIYTGVLPVPDGRKFRIVWPSLFTLNEQEQAEVNERRAKILATLAPGAVDSLLDMDGQEARELAMLPPFTDEQIAARQGALDEEDRIAEELLDRMNGSDPDSEDDGSDDSSDDDQNNDGGGE